MKRILCFVICIMMILSFSACQQNSDMPTTIQPAVKKHPTVIGTFMQPWAFKQYDQARMDQHLQYLKDVGIELLIIQSSFDVSEQSKELSEKDMAFLAVVLEAAQKVDMEVYVGLANDGDWWKKVFNDQQWLDDHVDISLKGAKKIYDTYKSHYQDTLTGWYFWPEYWNMDLDAAQTARGTKFLSDYRDGLYAIDSNMPMLLSPFITSAVDAKKTEVFWKDILSASTLRDGDIFCCQDSVGAGHVTINEMDAYFAAMKAAADTKPGLLFWANNEDFTPDYKSADMGRFKQQLDITDKYVQKHISFSFCHYRNPDMGKVKGKAYEAYKYYFQTGKLVEGKPAKPTVTVESHSQGLQVEFDVTVDNAAGSIHSVLITKDGEIIHEHIFGSDETVLNHRHMDINMDQPLVKRLYEVYVVDIYGNRSDSHSEFVTVFTIGM